MAKKKESPPKVGSHTEEKPLTPKEVDVQLKRGELTWEQAIALCQRYMDSLEYNEDQQLGPVVEELNRYRFYLHRTRRSNYVRCDFG